MRLVLAAALLIPAATSRADTRDWTPAAFDQVESAGSYFVSIVPGPRASIRADGDSRELSRMWVRVASGKLTVGSERGGWLDGMSYHQPIHLVVTTPTPLRGALLSGSGTMTVARVDAPEFRAEISGSGDIVLQQVSTRLLAASITGSGDIVATGHADRVSADVAGSGRAKLSDLRAVDLSAKIAGSGELVAFATRSATIGVTASGRARIRGGARCTVSKAGRGHVDCGA